MTWWLWLVLVLGSLALFAVLGLGLWRRVKTLGAELRALERLTAPLNAAAGLAPTPLVLTPGFLASAGELAEAREQRRRNVAARRGRRDDRAAAARSRWRQLGLR